MKCLAVVLLTFVSVAGCAQTGDNDFLDSFGLARLKNYSSHRATSGNRYVLSNDDSKRVLPGQTLVMAEVNGPGMITHIWLTIADNEFGWPRLMRFRVYYDGEKTPSVDSPLGDFFAVGHGSERDVNSMMVRDSSFGRARNSYWPMPFRKSCRITLTNEGSRILPMFYYHVDYRQYASLPSDLGYFHAYFRQERPARAGHNYEFLNVHGTGHYVGTVMSVAQTAISWFGEGDDLFYIDGADKPQILGTGTEDYFSDAWDLRERDGPWAGTPIAEGELPGSRLSGYRWHVPDPVAFTTSLWAGIEHSGWTSNPDGSERSGFEERPDDFSSVAFWYQKGVNQELPEPPYGPARLTFGNATQIAIEDSVGDVTTEKGVVSVLRDVDWAKDLLWFKAEGPGSKVNIPIDVKEDGRYEVVADIAEGPDYGDYTALFDGQPANVDTRKPATSEIPLPGPEVFHNYQPEIYIARDRTLGMYRLPKGRHVITLICVGREPRSVGYNLGINDVVIERVSDQPEPVLEAPRCPSDNKGPLFRGCPLDFYVTKLTKGSAADRLGSLRVIGSFGDDGASAVSAIAGALSDSDLNVRDAAAAALAQIGPAAAPAVAALAKALADPNARVRGLAAEALASIGPKAALAIPELLVLLNDPVINVRAADADAFGAIGPAAQPAVKAMAEKLLSKQDGMVLDSISYALGDIGPNAKDAIPALEQVVKEGRVDSPAAEAILKIEGKPVPRYY